MSITSQPWPAVGYEPAFWDVHPVSGMPRLDQARLGTTYQAAVTPQLRDLPLTLSGGTAAEAEEAATTLRAFDVEMGREIAPFAAVLLRSESAASSEIEQLSASARKIAEAEVNGVGSAHAEQIVANVHAMAAALACADRLDADAILTMHDALLRPSQPDIAGVWRSDQVWIGGRATFGAGSPHDAAFVPPVAERVPEAIEDLVAFAARDDLPVLPQVALAHAQFETIHPFPDGNGRTGRALLHAMLRAKGVTRQVSVPISSGLLTDTRGYVDALTAYRSGDIEPIVTCVSRAALIGVANGRHLVRDLTAVRGQWDERLVGLRADAKARMLADSLLRQPVVTAAVVRDLLGIDNNEHRHIDALVRVGILRSHQDFTTRNRLWRAQDVLDVLDAYAARTGRRGR